MALGRDRRLARPAARPAAPRRRQLAAAPVRHHRDPARHGLHRPGGRAARREPAARHAAGRDGAVGRPRRRSGGGRGRRGRRRLGAPAADGRRARLVRVAGPQLGRRPHRRRPAPRPARHVRHPAPAGGGGPVRTRLHRPVQGGAGPRPAADVDEHPASGRRRGGPVHREGARRRLPADPGGQRVRGRATASSSPTPTSSPARTRPSCSAATAPRCERGWWPSTRTATWRCCSTSDLDRPALGRADIDEGGVGAVFGHPGGGPLRAAPFSVGEIVTATGTDIYDQRETRARGPDPGVGPPAGRLRRRPHRPTRPTWSASPSPSPRTDPASPTPSPWTSSRPSSPATSPAPSTPAPASADAHGRGQGRGEAERAVGAPSRHVVAEVRGMRRRSPTAHAPNLPRTFGSGAPGHACRRQMPRPGCRTTVTRRGALGAGSVVAPLTSAT